MDKPQSTPIINSSSMKKPIALLILCFAMTILLKATETNVVYLMEDPVLHIGEVVQAICTAEQDEEEKRAPRISRPT